MNLKLLKLFYSLVMSAIFLALPLTIQAASSSAPTGQATVKAQAAKNNQKENSPSLYDSYRMNRAQAQDNKDPKLQKPVSTKRIVFHSSAGKKAPSSSGASSAKTSGSGY